MNDSEYSYASIIILLLSILLPTILLFGTIDDFIFQHLGLIRKYDIQGYIPETDPYFGNLNSGLTGFYAFGIMISRICNISYDILPFLPVQLISLVLLLLAVFKNINNNRILCSLLILIITTFTSNVSFLNFHPHGMGFTLFILFVLSIIILYRSKNANIHNSSFIIILLSLISINYVSYKAMAWTTILIIILLFIECTKYFLMRTNQKIIKTLVNMFLLNLIIIFSFNKFIYSQLLPNLRNIHSLGIVKILLLFNKDSSDSLSNYNLYHVTPKLNVMLISEIIIIFFTLLCFIEIVRVVYKDKIFDFNNKIFISLICTGLFNLYIYNLFGLFDLKFITNMGLISFLILHKKHSKKKLVYFFIAILLVMNLNYQVISHVHNDSQRDNNYFIYIRPSVNWYISHGIESILKTDVLTKGYYIKEIANKNVKYPSHFSKNDILFMLQKPFNVKPDDNIIYVANYKEEYFSITNWKILKSLKYFRGEIESNPYLNKVYTSSDFNIVIYSVLT